MIKTNSYLGNKHFLTNFQRIEAWSIIIFGLASDFEENQKYETLYSTCIETIGSPDSPVRIEGLYSTTYISRVPECLSIRPNWIPQTPLPQASVSSHWNQKGGGATIACWWVSGVEPIRTTGEKAWHSINSVFQCLHSLVVLIDGKEQIFSKLSL